MPGPGYGGSCFPKDTLALVKTAQDHDAPLRIVETVVAVNDARKRAMARKVAPMLGGDVRGKTDRDSGPDLQAEYRRHARGAVDPADHRRCRILGAKIRAYDPAGMEQAKTVLPDVDYCDESYDCAEGADALVIVTEWEQFRALDLDRLKARDGVPGRLDLRNIYRPDEIVSHGFAYESVGRTSRNFAYRREKSPQHRSQAQA